MRAKGAVKRSRHAAPDSKSSKRSSAAGRGNKRSREAQEPSRTAKRRRKASSTHHALLDYDEDGDYDVPSITQDQLKGIAVANQQSKRVNTQKNYGTQERKFQWYLTHDVSGGVRERPYSSNLLDPSAPNVLVGFLQWLDSGMPGYDGRAKTDKPKESTLKQVHAALQSLYEQQATAQHGRAEAPVALLFDHKPYRLLYNNMMAGIKAKGERQQGVDPQANTVEDTFSSEELQRMFTNLLQQETLEAGRNLSVFSYMACTISRHDDANLIYMADLGAPTLMECIGPAPCYLVSAVLCGGKRMADTKRKAYAGGIRHCEPVMCWQGALFRHLVIMYTLSKTPFPTITDDNTWYSAAIWPASNPTQNVDYDTLARQLSSLLQRLGITIGKVMHSFRVYAARYLDERGIPDEVIARMGKWLYQSIYNSYLRYFKPEGLLGLAGWPRAAQKDYTTFFHPRFCMPVPTELQQLLMPFLGCLEKEVQGMGKAATASRRAFLKLLRYGAGVVVQDALELVDLAPRNPVHQLLLRHPCFRAMHGEYKQRKAAGEFEAFKPLNTRELLQQILHKLNAACSPQPALDYTCMPMRQQLTTMEELEAVQQQNLDLLVAAAADAADEGAGDLLGEQVEEGDLIGLEGPPAPPGFAFDAEQQQQPQQQQQATEKASLDVVLPFQPNLLTQRGRERQQQSPPPLPQQQQQQQGQACGEHAGGARELELAPSAGQEPAAGDDSDPTRSGSRSSEDSGPAVSEGLSCVVCHLTDEEEVMLVCDTCTRGYHTHCLNMEEVPAGDWDCPACRRQQQQLVQPPHRRQARRQQQQPLEPEEAPAPAPLQRSTGAAAAAEHEENRIHHAAVPVPGATTSSEQQHLLAMRQQHAARQQQLQAPFQPLMAHGGFGGWAGVQLPPLPGLAASGAFQHLMLQRSGHLLPAAPGGPIGRQGYTALQPAVQGPQQQQPQQQSQQQQLLPLLQYQQPYQPYQLQLQPYQQHQLQLPTVVSAGGGLADASGSAAAATAAAAVPAGVGSAASSSTCPYQVQLPRKLSSFQSLSHVWAWYTGPLPDAGGLSPKQLEQQYGSGWRSGARNRQMWCHVLAVVRAVQQRVGTAIGGSRRGAQLDEQQIVRQLDQERDAVPVASFIRNVLPARKGDKSAEGEHCQGSESEPQPQLAPSAPAAAAAAVLQPTEAPVVSINQAGAASAVSPPAAPTRSHAQAAAAVQQRQGGSHSVRPRPELQGGVERNAVLLFVPGGPNDLPAAPGEQLEAAGEAPLEDLGSSLGRAVHRA